MAKSVAGFVLGLIAGIIALISSIISIAMSFLIKVIGSTKGITGFGIGIVSYRFITPTNYILNFVFGIIFLVLSILLFIKSASMLKPEKTKQGGKWVLIIGIIFLLYCLISPLILAFSEVMLYFKGFILTGILAIIAGILGIRAGKKPKQTKSTPTTQK